MKLPLVSKILFTVSFPSLRDRVRHIPLIKLQSLARQQLPDMDVIDTIDHLFTCTRCYENFRRIRKALLIPGPPARM